MTFYAGEEYKIVTLPTEFGTTEPILSDQQIGSVKVTIVDAAAVVIVNDAAMTWSALEQEWFYMWNSTGVPSGSYKAKVVVTALDGGQNWEIKRIRLAKNPF